MDGRNQIVQNVVVTKYTRINCSDLLSLLSMGVR
jgi:hypothetical protein